MHKIDIFKMHEVRQDPDWGNRAGAWQCLLDYKAKGIVKAIGVSTHHIDVVERMASVTECDIVFPLINYAGLGIRKGSQAGTADEMAAAIKRCIDAGKGVFAMKAFGGGNLTGTYMKSLNYVRDLGCHTIMIGMGSKHEVDDIVAYAEGRLPAIAVSGPFGAVKEQCSGLYAQTMAERGFLTIAFDPSFTGESGGQPRYMASPDINTEDFMAAVDFLSLYERVDPDRIGIIGICGWGGMAINTAALDTRIKATVASTMYDMTRVNANGYFDSEDSEEQRYAHRTAMCAQRLADLKAGEYALGGGVIDPLPEDAPYFVKDYHAYYKTDRGYHARSLNSNGGWNVIGCESFMNQPILKYSNEIRSAVMVMHGDKAHSFYFGKDAFDNMVNGNKYTDNKELLVIEGASHTDLYDGGANGAIPFDKLQEFFEKYL